MAFSYGRAGRLTSQNGGFRPGQLLELARPGEADASFGAARAELRALAGQNPHAGVRALFGPSGIAPASSRPRSA